MTLFGRRLDGSPSDSVPDILSTERRRFWRRTALGRVLSSRWSFTGVVMAIFALLVVPLWLGGGSEASPSSSPAEPVSDSGRPLNPSEVRVASKFGSPVALGDTGRPVVRHAVTGEVRELTDFELAWDGGAVFRFTDVENIVEAPGPRGHGVWWRDQASRREAMSFHAFGRHDWRARQQEELSFMADTLFEAYDVLWSWHGGPVAVPFSHRLAQVLDPLQQRYPFVRRDSAWAQVPGRWRCDIVTETQLSQGVTPGCPTPAYLALLDESWSSMGLLLADIYEARLILDAMDSLDSHALAGSGFLPQYRLALLDVARSRDRVQAVLKGLWARSLAEDLVIFVETSP